MNWLYLLMCCVAFVNGGMITVEFNLRKNGDSFECLPNTKSIQVTAGKDEVVLKIISNKEEDEISFIYIFSRRCFLKKNPTESPDLRSVDFRKDKEGNGKNDIFSATIKNINKEYETNWTCHIDILKDKSYSATCALEVVVNDPVISQTPPPPPLVTSSPKSSEENIYIWVYIGAGVAVLVISVISGQTACILYFKQKAKIVRRNARLSTRASSTENDSNLRYISLPGRKKKKPRNEEGIYETVVMRPLSPTPDCDDEEDTGIEKPITPPVMNRPPLPLPAFHEEASSSAAEKATGIPRPPSLSSLPRNKNKQKKMLASTIMEISAPDRNLPMKAAHVVPRPSPPVPTKPTARIATNEHIPTQSSPMVQKSPMISPMEIPLSPRSNRQLPTPNSILPSSATQPLTFSTKPEVKRNFSHNPNNMQISQELHEMFKKKGADAVSRSFHVNPKMNRSMTNAQTSTPSSPCLQPKSKSFSSTPKLMTSPEIPSSPKPFRPPPNRKVTSPIAATPSMHTSHTGLVTNGDLRVGLHNPEEMYEPIPEVDVSSDEEEWTYEPLPRYNIYNV